MNSLQIISAGLIPIGERKITRLTKTKTERYILHLPTTMNDLWRELYEKKVRIKIYIEISKSNVDNYENESYGYRQLKESVNGD